MDSKKVGVERGRVGMLGIGDMGVRLWMDDKERKREDGGKAGVYIPLGALCFQHFPPIMRDYVH